MTTVWEKQRIDDLQTEEARRHNQQIRERYLRLQNAEETQLAETFEGAEAEKAAREFTAQPFVAPETRLQSAQSSAAVNGAEQTKSVPLTNRQKELFGAETFRRMVAAQTAPEYTAEPEYVAAPEYTAAQAAGQRTEKQTEEAAVSQAETYSLTSAAKTLIAAFAALVVLMLTIIGINSRIIGAKGAELIALEAQKAELVEESRALAERIETEKSDETIERWAEENGWTRAQG